MTAHDPALVETVAIALAKRMSTASEADIRDMLRDPAPLSTVIEVVANLRADAIAILTAIEATQEVEWGIRGDQDSPKRSREAAEAQLANFAKGSYRVRGRSLIRRRVGPWRPVEREADR